jgi:hypothetical protein
MRLEAKVGQQPEELAAEGAFDEAEDHRDVYWLEDWWPHVGYSYRGGPGDPIPDPPGGWKPRTRFAWLATSALLVALIVGVIWLGYFVAGGRNDRAFYLVAAGLLTGGAFFLLRRIETRRRPISTPED